MTELAHLLAPLNVVLFTVGNDQVTVAELLGFVTGAASVWLTVLARVSNFPVGIANSAFFLVLFVSARLYADSGLQVVYIARPRAPPGIRGYCSREAPASGLRWRCG
jgi:nicotinamide mononucleotide transporter